MLVLLSAPPTHLKFNYYDPFYIGVISILLTRKLRHRVIKLV